MKKNPKKIIAAASLLLLFVLTMASRPPVSAAPALQLTEFPTPTPGPDGRILYTVREGDTLWRIAAISGLTLDELRRLNNLDAEAIINPGDVLLLSLGGAGAESPTPENALPTPVPGSLPPTPTSGPGTGIVCILLYADGNGDAVRQEEEPAVPGGAISLANRSGTISLQEETEPGPADSGDDPPRICFEDLLEGDYTVTVAIPDGYNATTDLTAAFKLIPGDTTFIDFGAQMGSEAIVVEQAETPEEGGRAPLFGIIGGLLLLAGLSLGIYAFLSGRIR